MILEIAKFKKKARIHVILQIKNNNTESVFQEIEIEKNLIYSDF